MNIKLPKIAKPTPEQLLQWAGILLTVAGAMVDKKVKSNEANAAKAQMKEEILNEILNQQNS